MKKKNANMLLKLSAFQTEESLFYRSTSTGIRKSESPGKCRDRCGASVSDDKPMHFPHVIFKIFFPGRLSSLKLFTWSIVFFCLTYQPRVEPIMNSVVELSRNNSLYPHTGARGSVVIQALRYKPEGRGFDSRWCHWIFSLTHSFRLHYGPGVDSASNRNEHQEHFLAVKEAGA
jgi:hypothetical protein